MPSIPHRDTRGEFIVRPDLVCISFVLRLEGPDSKATLGTLEKATQAIQQRFGAVTGGSATTNMLGVNVTSMSSGKAKSDEPGKFVVTVDGSVEVPLAADADYWARARLLSALVQASHDPKPLVPPPAEDQPEMETAFGAPEVKLRNPDVHRPELIKRWIERTRAFSRLAESEKAPLNIVNCEPPQVINQTQISIEQIGLSLPVSCRVDVARVTP